MLYVLVVEPLGERIRPCASVADGLLRPEPPIRDDPMLEMKNGSQAAPVLMMRSRSYFFNSRKRFSKR